MTLMGNDLACFFCLKKPALPGAQIGRGWAGIGGPCPERPNCILTRDTASPAGPILQPGDGGSGPRDPGGDGPEALALGPRRPESRQSHEAARLSPKAASDRVAGPSAWQRRIRSLPARCRFRGKLRSKNQKPGFRERPKKRQKAPKKPAEMARIYLVSPKNA